MVENLINEFKNLEEVDAIMLGGSRASGIYDENSDYDFYVYLNKPLAEIKRRDILSKYVQYMEFSNSFWELEDDGILNNGIDIEFIYREFNWIDEMLGNLVFKGYVSNGYSTCFLDNLLNSEVVFDKTGKIEELRNKYKKAISKDLFDKIIEKNFPIILDKMPSLYYQVEKAIKRNDLFSINHRVTAFFEMYFDIVFAVNETLHPGEKRLLETASNLDKTPQGMKHDFEELFSNLFQNNKNALIILEKMAISLHTFLEDNGYHFSFRSYK